MSSVSTALAHQRFLHSAACYLSIISIYNPGGWPTILLALTLLRRFPVGMLACNLLLVLSLVTWIDYGLFRRSKWRTGLRVIAYLCLAVGAGVTYFYLTFANSAYIATAALVLGLVLWLSLRRLSPWLPLEDFIPRWG